MQNKSGNPALSNKALERLSEQTETASATISGTAYKVAFLIALTFLGGVFGWRAMASASGSVGLMILVAAIVSGALAFVTIFKPTIAKYTSPLYALGQGYVLGAISQIYNVSFDGIVLQAISLTGAIFIVSLWMFSMGLIKVNNKFRTIVIIATAGIAVYYLIAFIAGLFGATMPLIYDTGTFGILFSVAVVFIAALNLLLDYDLIQTMVQRSAPKHFEWYGAFALVVTLIWLYIEVLRLLGKSRS